MVTRGRSHSHHNLRKPHHVPLTLCMQILAICLVYWCFAALKSKVIDEQSLKVLDFSLHSDGTVDDNDEGFERESVERVNLEQLCSLGDDCTSPIFASRCRHEKPCIDACIRVLELAR